MQIESSPDLSNKTWSSKYFLNGLNLDSKQLINILKIFFSLQTEALTSKF